MQEARHEVELQDLGLRIQLHQQELGIRADAALMQEARHEVELQDLGLRIQLHQQELGIRAQQAQVQMLESQAALADREAKRQLEGDKQKFDISRSLVTLPPQPMGNGKWMVFEMGPTGEHRSVTVDDRDPRVVDVLTRQRDMEARATMSEAHA